MSKYFDSDHNRGNFLVSHYEGTKEGEIVDSRDVEILRNIHF